MSIFIDKRTSSSPITKEMYRRIFRAAAVDMSVYFYYEKWHTTQ